MLIFAPQETDPNEPRAAVTPETAARLVKLGAAVAVESGIGAGANYSDAAYEKAGAALRGDRAAALREADVVLRVRRPPAAEVALLKQGAVHVSFLDPFNETALVDALAQQGVSAVSMELVPAAACPTASPSSAGWS